MSSDRHLGSTERRGNVLGINMIQDSLAWVDQSESSDINRVLNACLKFLINCDTKRQVSLQLHGLAGVNENREPEALVRMHLLSITIITPGAR